MNEINLVPDSFADLRLRFPSLEEYYDYQPLPFENEIPTNFSFDEEAKTTLAPEEKKRGRSLRQEQKSEVEISAYLKRVLKKFPVLSNPEKACQNELKVRSDNFQSTLMSLVCKMAKEIRDFVSSKT